jgi:hypothetical protein
MAAMSSLSAMFTQRRAFGRPRHPRLRVCFALLAGLAPLHVERFIARGG